MSWGLEEAIIAGSAPVAAAETWSYQKAFTRHRGLLTSIEQNRLRNCRVAVPGMGGVGGVHVSTLSRLGIGKFRLADPDSFDIVNFNRQCGATVQTLGRNKAEVMAEMAASINPEADIRFFPERIAADNVADFLEGVDIVVDGIDFFAIESRRLLYREARQRGLWVVTAGPLGFGTAWMAFDPNGMSFDAYFDLDDRMDHWSQIIAFAVGLTPRALHLSYMDLNAVDPHSGAGPSAGLACQLCSGVAATEVMKILLGRTPTYAAPWSFQFDAYRHLLTRSRLRWGNRGPWQRIKRWLLRRKFGI
jgi:molybdopterin/thiamine biosynthesis adenylyltransferase